MSDQALVSHSKVLSQLEDTVPNVRQGVVTQVSPLKVTIAGTASAVFARALDGTGYAVSDKVSILQWKGDALVLGRSTNTPTTTNMPYFRAASSANGTFNGGTGASPVIVPGLTFSITPGVWEFNFSLDINFNATGGIPTFGLYSEGTSMSSAAFYAGHILNLRCPIVHSDIATIPSTATIDVRMASGFGTSNVTANQSLCYFTAKKIAN